LSGDSAAPNRRPGTGGPPMLDLLLRLFLLPGNLIGDALGARAEDDRAAIRVMMNMLFWNAILVVVAFEIAF
jgi:hypothetical protein